MDYDEHCCISEVAFSPDSRRILSVYDTTLQVLDAITGQTIGDPRNGHTKIVCSVVWLTDDWFVSVSSDKSLVIWHCALQHYIARIERAHVVGIQRVLRLSKDSFATTDFYGTIKRWKLFSL